MSKFDKVLAYMGAIFVSVIGTMLIVFIFSSISHSIQDAMAKPSVVPSELFGGYSEVKVYEIYDRDTGVYYAVTEDGGMTPLYNPDGTLKLVDGGDPQ